MKGIHHVEIWIADLDAVVTSWDWLFTSLGLPCTGEWPGGRTWNAYPHAGGPDHYAGWLENAEGFKVEIVAG